LDLVGPIKEECIGRAYWRNMANAIESYAAAMRPVVMLV